jgi:hypothetical protein
MALWLLCFGWYAIFAMVHLETRYLAPVVPFAVLIGLTNIVWLVPRRAALVSDPERPNRGILLNFLVR